MLDKMLYSSYTHTHTHTHTQTHTHSHTLRYECHLYCMICYIGNYDTYSYYMLYYNYILCLIMRVIFHAI